jgi:hypothetical protein
MGRVLVVLCPHNLRHHAECGVGEKRRPDAGVFDAGAIRAVGERGGRRRLPEASAQRLPAALASVEAGQ